jgi:hypothetical protein
MHPTRLLVLALLRAQSRLAAGLTLVLAAGVQPAAATTSVPPPVALGSHRFGHLHPPEAVVARADPEVVGFSSPPEGADGVSYGPWSFDVAPDGSIWLLDELTSSHGLKPCDSRFTLPLPQRGHQRRSAGLRPTGSDGSPRTRQAAPAGLAG